jgi:acetyltransferase-like isoleucine patch superfamily enzyme
MKKYLQYFSFILPSCFKTILYRIMGHKIGRNTKLSIFSLIVAEKIFIKNDVQIRPFSMIMVKRLEVGNNTIISYGVQIKGAKSFITKDNCMVGVESIIHCDEDVSLGFYSGIGPRNLIYTHGSFLPVTEGFPVTFNSVTIEDYVWLGMSVNCLPGAHIESNCIIMPGVIVSGRVKKNTLMKIEKSTYSKIQIEKVTHPNQIKFYNEIISEFLKSQGFKFQLSGDTYSFADENQKGQFKIISTDEIHLNYGKKTVIYHLGNYYASYSKNKLNMQFIDYIRRHYGIILRNKYQ